MTSANLLPEPRRERRRDRRIGRRWALGLAAWCATLVTAHWTLERRRTTDAAPPHDRAAALAAEAARLLAEAAGLEADASLLRGSIDAARATVDHPDWSILLARIVRLRDESMVFRRWRLARQSDSAMVLRIEGDARSIGAPSAFAIDLESLGVFRRVFLGSAERTEDERGPLVRFAIDAELLHEESRR